MKVCWKKLSLVLAITMVCCGSGNAQTTSKPDFHEVLRWFPADINAVAVANGPFPLADLHDLEALLQNDDGSPEVFSDDQLRKAFEIPALAPLVKRRTRITKLLQGERVLLAVGGFRSGRPGHLAESCTALVFQSQSIRDKLLKPAAGPALTEDDIDGHGFVVFEDTAEQDDASSLVIAQPRPDALVVCESLNYLKSVLARARGRQGERALPDTLPEWGYVDTHAAFWAFGHHRGSGSKEEASKSDPDNPWESIFGATMSFDPTSKTGKMIYLSSDPDIFNKIEKENSGSEMEDEDSVNITFREVEPGVVEETTALVNRSTTSKFVVYGVWFLAEL